ncbi:cache domain-containing protein [Rhodopila sp.]|uniref:cache domain-containing protein n=1 Tax=Rhodopila sp. TaxID=2480087 RepID=UPI002CD81340|nr:cache domain-containing protein [Rhodopila sp.]HVZ08936.1 cache domain-containing protein [Rhodopila sp.]
MRRPSWNPLALSIQARLHAATVAALAAVAAVLFTVYGAASAQLLDARTTMLRAITDSAVAIAAGYEQAARNGQMTEQEAQAAAATAIGHLRYLGPEYVWINDMQARMVMHPVRPDLNGHDMKDFADPNGKRLFAAMVDTVRDRGAGAVDYLWPRPGAQEPVPKLSYVQGFQPWGWVIGTGVYIDDLIAARRHLAWVMVGYGAIVLTLVGAVITWLARSVARPVRRLVDATDRLSAGELSVAIAGEDRADEFGALARALAALRDAAQERVRLERAAEAQQADRNRRQVAMEHLTQEFGSVVAGVLARLTAAARSMTETAQALATAARETQANAAETAEGSASSSADLSTVAAATVELSASVDEIARQVTTATGATRNAVEKASESDRAFINLIELASKIGHVGSAIAAIADQTNLLALNATIEAARAGEAGKGFAVVAGEVKALAAQTARATTEIRQDVEAMTAATENSAAAIQAVNGAIDQIDAVAAAIAAAIEQQGATTRDIAANVQSVSHMGERAAAAMAAVASAADRTGGMSRSMLAAAREIGDVSTTLQSEVEHFLAAMARDDGERRRYERVSGQRTEVQVAIDGASPRRAVILNISRGGAALQGLTECEAGTPVQLRVESVPVAMAGRIVRGADGITALVFNQDTETLRAVDAVLDLLARHEARPQAA